MEQPRTPGAYESPWDKLVVSWFQGVTPRTAGFNTVDIGATHDVTSPIILLMLVGGGPTSTARGIKVTTFLVLLLTTVALFKRCSELTAFGRSIPLEDVLKVTALTSVAILLVMAATFLVLVRHDGDFMGLAFEVVSAFGTVGLSRGATGDLDATGRAVIVFVMFAGRVGPLTLGFFPATRTRPRVRHPKSPVFLGWRGRAQDARVGSVMGSAISRAVGGRGRIEAVAVPGWRSIMRRTRGGPPSMWSRRMRSRFSASALVRRWVSRT